MGVFNPQIEKILLTSVEQYEGILQYAENLLTRINSCDYSLVSEYVVKLQQLQSDASQQDEQLLPLLQLDTSMWEKHELFQKRLGFIKSIVVLNKLLVEKINGVMAVTSSELDKLSGGRNALAGYTSQAVDRRGSLGVG